jgi:CRP/FNR family transcriptional regulator, cyclic AMP receptor protein
MFSACLRGMYAGFDSLAWRLHSPKTAMQCSKQSDMGGVTMRSSNILANHSSMSHHTRQSRQPFSNLRGEALERFNQIAMEVSYARGGSLFVADQNPQYIFIVKSGRIKLSVMSRDGKVAILRIAQAGEVLGMSAALSGTAHELTAEAIELCNVNAIRVKDFMAFLQQYPEAGMEATRCVLQEYQMAFNNVCRLALPATVAGRLANLLLEWLKNRLDSGSKERRLVVPLTQEEIAGMTGTSRETISRVLHQFQQEKLISVKGTCLTVLQPKALELMAV